MGAARPRGAGADRKTAGELGLTRRRESRALFMANANPFDCGASHGIGQRIERVADQSKNLLDADVLKHTDQRIRDCLSHDSSDISLADIALVHRIAAAVPKCNSPPRAQTQKNMRVLQIATVNSGKFG
jgi:hypothetical protein